MSRAMWVYEKDVMDLNSGAWRCSVCRGRNANIGGNDRINPLLFSGSKFCPHCGERMDGKPDERRQKRKMGGTTMEKLTTVQQKGKLNEVYRVDDKAEDGAYHTYIIAKAPDDNGECFAENPIRTIIRFQKGPRDEETSRVGVLDADLIEIVRDRLKCFQEGKYACQENALAIGYLEAALAAMNDRVEDRIRRGVLGTEKL